MLQRALQLYSKLLFKWSPQWQGFFSSSLRKKSEERNRWDEHIWKPLRAEIWSWLFSCFLWKCVSGVRLSFFWIETSSSYVILIICGLDTQSNIWTGFERETERLPLSLSSCEGVAGQPGWEHRRDPTGTTDQPIKKLSMLNVSFYWTGSRQHSLSFCHVDQILYDTPHVCLPEVSLWAFWFPWPTDVEGF